MVCTRSRQKTKEEENSNVRVTRSNVKGKINTHFNVLNTVGIRKSSKETSLKKKIAIPMSTQKTEQVEKRAPPTPAATKESESVEKEKMSSPWTRSGRTRSHSSSGPSDSKSLGSLGSRKKQKKEKSVTQLTFEAREVNDNEGQDLGASEVKTKRMDARMYRALFKHHKKGCLGKLNRVNLNQEGNNDTGVMIDDFSKGGCSDHNEVGDNCSLSSEDAKARETKVDSRLLNGIATGLVENSVIPTCETSVVPERGQPDCCGEETLPISVSKNTILDENLGRNSVGQDGVERLVSSKRKAVTGDMDSDVSATLSKDDNYNLIPDASSPPRLDGNILGTDGSCTKQIRLDYNPTLNESCDPCATEHQDGHDNEATMLQKDYPTNVAKNICLVCKGEGQLSSCGGKGCNGYYHLSCLEPSMPDATLGVWHCQFCVRKKIELGVYSVSEGVESICDVKEASFPNVDGFLSRKEFLVKYKGLAHVHNRWVAESQLLLEAPLLLMKFNQKDQTPSLKPEWSLPHRLLQKRVLIFGKQHDDNHAVDDFGYEWLVKWRGLGYEHVTWELENASFLRSSEGQSLIRGYEARFQRAKRVSLCSKSDKKPDRGNSINILPQMPGGLSAGFGNHNLDAVNKLREHWHKGQNAIVIDDHDRILKVVAFILSLHSDTYRPFLIISTAASLHSWEDEFYQTDPSIDVVIYNGNKEIRNNIRRLEFYDEKQCILFQVLIVAPDVIVEDMSILGGIKWEAIIVDECQSPEISSYFKQIRMFSTHLKVLLFCGQLRDSIVENNNMLALLDGQSDNEKDGLTSNSHNRVVPLKEKLSSYIAYRCKSASLRFVEYWVPAQISHVQLEQYCATLLSNAPILRSSLKVDSVGAIRDVLISIRKCCSHPYIFDLSSQASLIKGLEEAEYLGVGIKASGKLELLDSMLTELRKNNLRVLILFQSIGGSGRDTIGDFLDDFLRQRFGLDSFERIDKSVVPSKKQAAMKKFNDKNNGSFVFLLETCACLPSIKLSSIDTIIIFDSDWNPVNDIRSLQKITLDSQFESIKIFRLYSAFTIEEKALILAKQDKNFDINLVNTNRSTSHTLLMWGASCLFDELRVFHDGATSTSSRKSLFGRPLLEETVQKFSSILSEAAEDTDTTNCSILLKVQQNGGAYRANFPLLGELKLGSLDEESPQVFWSKLLEGKRFQWKYSCSSSQRSRKRVQHYGSLVDGPNLANEGIVKKRRKVSNNVGDQPSSKSEGENLCTEAEADTPQGTGVESEKNSKVHDEQRSLHLSLKPEITKLCEVLLLPDNVTKMVHNFLEYVMNNHHINREPVSTLQAFQISLTWTAAALLKHKLDHKTSLVLSQQYLKFDCKKGEVDYIYSMLRCLKKIFLYRTGSYYDTDSPKASKSSNRVYPYSGVTPEVELFTKDLSKSIKEIRKKCEKHLKKVRLMQQEEKQAFKVEKDGFERKYKIELALISSCSPNDITRTEKLKVLNIEYEKMKQKLETRLKVLEDNQSAQILKFQEWETTWVEGVKSWAQNELSKELCTGVASKHDANEVDIMILEGRPVSRSEDQNITENPYDCQENNISEQSHSREHISGGASKVSDREAPLDLPGTINITDCLENVTSVNPPSMEQISDGGALIEFSDGVLSSSCRTASLSIGPVNGSPLNPHLEHQNSGVSSGIPQAQETPNEGSLSALERPPQAEIPPPNATPLSSPPSVDEISDRDGVLSSSCRTASLSIDPVNGSPLNPHLEHQNSGVSSGIPQAQETPNEGSVSALERPPQAEIPPPNATPLSSPPSVDEISDRDGVLSSSCGIASLSIGTVNGSLLNPHLEHQNSEVSSGIPQALETPNEGDSVSALERPPQAEIPPPNATSLSPPPSVGEISDRDGVLSSSCRTASLSIGPVNGSPLNPHLEHQNSGVSLGIPQAQENPNEGDSVSALERPPQAEIPPPNATPLSPPPSVDEISDRGLLDVPVLDCVLSSRHCQAASSSNSPDTIFLSNPPVEQPIPVAVSLSIPDGDIPVTVPENSHAMANSHDDIEPSIDAVLVDKSTTYGQEEGVLRPVAGQLHEPSNTSDLPTRHPEASIVVSDQNDVQPHSYAELESDSHQVAMQPASNSDLDSLTARGVRAQSSNPRNLPAAHSASRMLPHLSYDPLQKELERMQKEEEQALKTHEERKSRLKSDFEKDVAELRRKYDIKYQELEVEFQQNQKTLASNRSAVGVNKFLAHAFRSKCLDLKVSGASGMQRDSRESRQQIAVRALVSGSSSSATGLLPAISPTFSQGPPRPRPTIYRSDPQMGHRPDNVVGLATPNLPAMDLRGNASSQSTMNFPNFLSRMSDVAPGNLSRFGTRNSSMRPNSSHQATNPEFR